MKNSNSKLPSLTIGIVGFVWAIGVFSLASIWEPHIAYGGTLAFGVLAVSVAIVYLICFRFAPDRRAEEVGALSMIVTIVYVIAALVGNTAMMIAGNGGINTYLPVVNVVINACYVIVILYAERNVRRISARLDRTEQKAIMSANISSKLGTLLSIAEDKELHHRLLKLKEAVDYGSNITTAHTVALEQQMAEQLDELVELIAADGPEEMISSKLREIEQCWKMRSSAASSMK